MFFTLPFLAPHPTAQQLAMQRPIPTHRWGISTLHEQIHARHVTAVAFDESGKSVEVMDTDGLERRVDIFPEAQSMLVADLRQEHIPLYVAPQPKPTHSPALIILARAWLLTILVVALIDLAGFMPEFIFGCMIVGAIWAAFLQALDRELVALWVGAREALAEGQLRFNAAVQQLASALLEGHQPQADPIPIYVDDEQEGPFDS